MANLQGTTTRTVRVPDDLWNGAIQATVTAGETVADVINRALEQYVASPPREGSRRVAEKLVCAVCGKAVGRIGGGNRAVRARHANPDGAMCEGGGV